MNRREAIVDHGGAGAGSRGRAVRIGSHPDRSGDNSSSAAKSANWLRGLGSAVSQRYGWRRNSPLAVLVLFAPFVSSADSKTIFANYWIMQDYCDFCGVR